MSSIHFVIGPLKKNRIRCFFIFQFSFLIFYSLNPASGQNILSEPLKNAWAGGLNSCQLCTIDLNLDGIDDLLVFDRHGNRKLTFINSGTFNTSDYIFSPKYAQYFPECQDWIRTVDYDCDGKQDLFTYSSGGIRVFKNISDTTLRFQLVTDMLKSFYYSSYIGILVTSVDYPAIADIDNDGDLDILTFFGLGSFVEYHKNLSMEKFGNCDSLDYRLTDHCWGKFKESEGGNQITLNANCQYTVPSHESDWSSQPGFFTLSDKPGRLVGNPLHTGSTILATDLNDDGVKDLLMGDMDYPNLIALTNGGTKDTAFMIDVDTAFPSNSVPIRLFSFPSLSFFDADNDGKKDLLISPFDPGFYTSENQKSIWFYKNTGSNSNPVFEFQTNRFLQGDMLDFGSNSFPVLFDFNSDGLLDLFVGNYGIYDSSWYYQTILHSSFTARIAYFKNEGSNTAPMFRQITSDLAGIAALHLKAVYPAFGDINSDGKPDLIIGNSDSTLIYFENIGFTGDLPAFGSPQFNYQHIAGDVRNTPQLFDLNKDGLLDLILGGRKGKLSYYRNYGTSVLPLFQLDTDSLGRINVTNYNISYDGLSTPFFFRDNSQTTHLVVGSEEGKIHYYTQIDDNLEGKFRESDSLFSLIGGEHHTFSDGWRSSATLGHLSNTNLFDLITGNFSGGLRYFSSTITPGIFWKTPENYLPLKIYPNPADDIVAVEIPFNISRQNVRQPGYGKIKITDLFGRSIRELSLSGKMIISVKDLPAGIYLIRWNSSFQKLVIHHL